MRAFAKKRATWAGVPATTVFRPELAGTRGSHDFWRESHRHNPRAGSAWFLHLRRADDLLEILAVALGRQDVADVCHALGAF